MSACIRKGCEAKARARYLCAPHYHEALGTGDLPPRMSNYGKTPLERFQLKVRKTETCWLWEGGLTTEGYGSFRADGQSNAHRWSYTFHVGPVPEGLDLDHLCRVRHCVNPDHLEPVTTRENTMRGALAASIRARAAALTHCPHGHEKSEENTYRSFNAKRNRWESVCRPCRNARLRRNAEKRREARNA